LGPPNISPNFEYRVPNFFLQLERSGLHISAKFRKRIPNRGSQGANQIFQFFWMVVFNKGYGKIGYSQLHHSQCVSFGGKIRNFLSLEFCNFFL